MPGVGKSFLGNYAAKKLNVQFFDLDEALINKYKISVARLFESKGEEEFRMLQFEMLKEITTNCNDDTIIATGGGTACFNNAMDYMNENGITVWLNAGFRFLVDNILIGNAERPLFKDLSNKELLVKVTELFAVRQPFYAKSSVSINVYRALRADLFTKSLHLSTFDLDD